MAKIRPMCYDFSMNDTNFDHLPSMMTDDTPEARAWRAEQADVDSDIEGLAKPTPEDEAYSAHVDTLDISDEEKIEMMKAYFIQRNKVARASRSTTE